jgi:hypothetical protein
MDDSTLSAEKKLPFQRRRRDPSFSSGRADTGSRPCHVPLKKDLSMSSPKIRMRKRDEAAEPLEPSNKA